MPDAPESEVPPPQAEALSSGERTGRALGCGVFLVVWVVVAGFSAALGGALVGLRPGGWNFQYLALWPIAIIGGPVVGAVVAAIRMDEGRRYWEGLWEAILGVAAAGFLAGLLYYGLR